MDVPLFSVAASHRKSERFENDDFSNRDDENTMDIFFNRLQQYPYGLCQETGGRGSPVQFQLN